MAVRFPPIFPIGIFDCRAQSVGTVSAILAGGTVARSHVSSRTLDCAQAAAHLADHKDDRRGGLAEHRTVTTGHCPITDSSIRQPISAPGQRDLTPTALDGSSHYSHRTPL